MLRKERREPCTGFDPDGFCGFCYENLRARAYHPGHRFASITRPHSPQRKEILMKRTPSQAAPKKGEVLYPDKDFAKDYPSLALGMCDGWWDDGKPREVWSLTIRFEAQAVHLCLNDKGASMGLYTTGESLNDALACMEECLSQGTASWRRWRK